LQLHELRFAVRSPVGRAEEDDDRAVRTEKRRERARVSMLVAQAEGGQGVAHFGAEGIDVDLRGWIVRLERSRVADARRDERQAQHENASEATEGLQHTALNPLLRTIIPAGR